jgi:hypothetical protein
MSLRSVETGSLPVVRHDRIPTAKPGAAGRLHKLRPRPQLSLSNIPGTGLGVAFPVVAGASLPAFEILLVTTAMRP